MYWKELEVWKKAHMLVLEIYNLTSTFPRYFVLLSKELGYITDEKYQNLESAYETVSKMLNGLIKSLKT